MEAKPKTTGYNKDLCVVTAPDQYLLCDSNWGKANNHTQLLLGHNKSNKK